MTNEPSFFPGPAVRWRPSSLGSTHLPPLPLFAFSRSFSLSIRAARGIDLATATRQRVSFANCWRASVAVSLLFSALRRHRFRQQHERTRDAAGRGARRTASEIDSGAFVIADAHGGFCYRRCPQAQKTNDPPCYNFPAVHARPCWTSSWIRRAACRSANRTLVPSGDFELRRVSCGRVRFDSSLRGWRRNGAGITKLFKFWATRGQFEI